MRRRARQAVRQPVAHADLRRLVRGLDHAVGVLQPVALGLQGLLGHDRPVVAEVPDGARRLLQLSRRGCAPHLTSGPSVPAARCYVGCVRLRSPTTRVSALTTRLTSHPAWALPPDTFFFLITRPPPRSTLFPYTTLFR